jgi:hypothetical protein
MNNVDGKHFAEQQWLRGARGLDLLVQAQAHWWRFATACLALNGSRATAVNMQSFWSAQFLKLQRAAWVQWRAIANGLNPLSPASARLTEKAWQDLANGWQQGAQKILLKHQDLLSALTQVKGKSRKPNRVRRPAHPSRQGLAV